MESAGISIPLSSGQGVFLVSPIALRLSIDLFASDVEISF